MEDFDFTFYLETYPDLKKAGIIHENQAYRHYTQYGKHENRVKNLDEMKNRIHVNEIKINSEYQTYTKKKNTEEKINILIRTSDREEKFKKCIESIHNQQYSNYKIIVCYDKICSREYINENIENFHVEIDSEEHYKYNLYCNLLLEKVKEGFILFLDDDDYLCHSKVFQIINDNIDDKNSFLIWNYMRTDQLIYPKKLPIIKLGEIASCSFLFHSLYKNIKWEDKIYGDFRFVKCLLESHKLKIKYIDFILTKINSTISIGNFGI